MTCIAITFIICVPFCKFIVIRLPPSVCTYRDAPESQSSSDKPVHSDYSNMTIIFGSWKWGEHAKWDLDWAGQSSNGICCDSGKGHWPKCPWGPCHHISIVFPCPYHSCDLAARSPYHVGAWALCAPEIAPCQPTVSKLFHDQYLGLCNMWRHTLGEGRECSWMLFWQSCLDIVKLHS